MLIFGLALMILPLLHAMSVALFRANSQEQGR